MKLFTNDDNVHSDITDVWNISKQDLKKINENMILLENKLHEKHQGHYFDYQLVDNFFNELSDFDKAMIFVYGQLVHEHIYKKNL
jgi:hypothetical protein